MPRDLVEKYTRKFRRHDVDRDGYLDSSQVKAFLSSTFKVKLDSSNPSLKKYVFKRFKKYAKDWAVCHNGNKYYTLLTILTFVRDTFHEGRFVNVQKPDRRNN